MKNGETVTIPGLVDFHTHLRDPSVSDAETMREGTLAAALGGYVFVKDMPNNPGMPTWTVDRMLEKHEIINRDAFVCVGAAAGSQPESDNLGELSELSRLAIDLKLYGAPTTGNSNDYEAEDFKDIVKLWHESAPDKPIGFHAGKDNLEDMIQLVSKQHNHHLHVCHVSSSEEVELVNQAKRAGLPVTCGVTPHHLLMSSHDVHTRGWFARMQPPLTAQTESERLMSQLADGEIDIVETDHAPHSFADKLSAEHSNPTGKHDEKHETCFGVPGIEYAFPLLAYQVLRGRITMERLVDAMSTRPAEILGVEVSPDLKSTWEINPYQITNNEVVSGAGWTPFLGMMAIGEVKTAAIDDKEIISSRGSRVVMDRGAEVQGTQE